MDGNFKVRALKSNVGFFDKGDTIEFKNGICRWIDGEESCIYENFDDLVEQNDWLVECLELIEEGENKMEDLRELIKPCYVVVRRNKDVCGIFEIQDGLQLQEKLHMGNCMLMEYNKDLKKYNYDDTTDIIAIYGLSTNSFDIAINGRPLIWKRIEKSQTQLEIESIEIEQRKLADRLSKLREI